MVVKSRNREVITTVYRLLIGFLIAVVLIVAAITLHLQAHSEIDDLKFNFHSQSFRHIDRIRHQLLLLKTTLGQSGADSGVRFMEAVHTIARQTKGLRQLQDKYRVETLQLLLAQYEELARPLMGFPDPKGTAEYLLQFGQIEALLLKLAQLERQHEISARLLVEHDHEKEHQEFLMLLLFLLVVGVIFGVVVFRVLRDIKRLVSEQEQTEASLFKEKEYLRITLESIGDAVITTDSEGLVTGMNPVAQRLTGWDLVEARGQTMHEVFPIINATTREPIENPVDKVIATGEVVYLSNHTTLVSRSGEEYQIADSAAPIRGHEDGFIQGMVLVFNDVTEQYRLREEAAKDRRDLRAIMDFSPTLIQVRDLEGRYVFVNRQFELAFGQTREKILGRAPHELFSPEQLDKFQADHASVVASGKAVENREGSLGRDLNRTYMTTTFPLLDGKKDVYAVCSVSSDITTRKQQEEKILHQAHFDALTELPNRFLCLDRLSQKIKDATRQGYQLAVLFIDLDDFKKVNDSLGHETGDKLLVSAAERLRSVVRSEDTVGRLGGDEFLVLLGGLQQASDAIPVVENLVDQFRRSFGIDGREILLTSSIGLAVFPSDGDTPSQLLRNADTAMYHAKEGGRNTYSFFTEAMNLEVGRRLALEEQLHGALARKEFSVAFQPQVKISNGEVIGVEALLRWENAALGDIPPGEFIPIAEQTGIIIQLGKFVLDEALSQVTLWREKYAPDFRVSVNVSPRQFRDPNLVTDVRDALEKHAVPGESLELEITEGVLLTAQVDIGKQLDSLRALGVSIALDDFGTGYASLSYLRTYSFDLLKVDRSFVNDITDDPADRALVDATIAMARALGLSVVAEGVETAEQLNLLRDMGCDAAQGFHLGKPVVAKQLAKLLWTQQ